MKVKEISTNSDYRNHFRNFLIKIVLLLYSPLFYLLILFHKITSRKKEYKYGVTLCLIFKDEGKYLKEWLDYHILIGVEHFYLYNNFSTDNYKEILKEYIDNGLVTLIEFPVEYGQLKAYHDCYDKFHNEAEWIGFIDADEFVNLVSYDNIGVFLNRYRSYPSLYLNWLMFGTSGHLTEDYRQLTIERYTQCWDFLCSTGKTFINNNFNHYKFVSVHFNNSAKFLNIPLFSVSPNKAVSYKMHSLLSGGISKQCFLNHYWSRSLDFFMYKNWVKGDAAGAKYIELRKCTGRLSRVELKATTKNFVIQRWLIYLKSEKTRGL